MADEIIQPAVPAPKANFGNVNWNDFLKGLLVTVGTAVLGGISTSLVNGALPTVAQLKAIGILALSAGTSYVIKNLLTNSQDQLFTTEKSVPKP